jgi:flagellar basal body-associated protein FliL
MEDNTRNTGGNKGMMIIIMGMLGLIILALAGVGVFLIMGADGIFNRADNNNNALVQEYEPIPGLDDQLLFNMSSGISANVLTRPGGPRNMVHMQMSIGINNLVENDATAIYESIGDREMAVISIVSDLLRQTTIYALDAPGGHDILREDIIAALQMHFNTNLIVAVYFQLITI